MERMKQELEELKKTFHLVLIVSLFRIFFFFFFILLYSSD